MSEDALLDSPEISNPDDIGGEPGGPHPEVLAEMS
jgi:hypothetical protein